MFRIKKINTYLISLLLVTLLSVWFAGCESDSKITKDPASSDPVAVSDRGDCEECHRSREMLVLTMEPSDGEAPPSSGEG